MPVGRGDRPGIAHIILLGFVILQASSVIGPTPSPALARPNDGMPYHRPSASQENDTTFYRVKVALSDAGDPPDLEVVARFPQGTNEIVFSGPSVGIEPDEWHRRWVDGFTVRDTTLESVPVRRIGPGRWTVEAPPPGGLVVSYSVDLGLALTSWPAGNEHAAYWEGNALYAVGEALFATAKGGDPSHVEFVVPEGWEISTPWRQAGAAPSAFTVGSSEELLDNAMVLGRYAAITHRARGFRYELALIGKAAGAADRASRLAEVVLDAYVRLFDGAPDGAYLQAMFVSEAEDGEAFRSSSGFRTSLVPDEHNVVLWGNQLAHELFHRWMSSDAPIAPASYDDSQWLSEGLAEYYANLTLLRTDVIDIDAWLGKMEKHVGLYLYYRSSPAFEASLKSAGADKWRERLAVYNGGWTAAFCLDVRARRATRGRTGLDAFMKGLWESFGAPGVPYVFADLPGVFETSTGVAVDTVFDRFIAGTETLPVEECLNAAGIEAGIKGYAAELWAWSVDDPTSLQKAVWDSLSSRLDRGPGK